MQLETPDPRDIPILTETVKEGAPGAARASFDAKSAHAAIVTETLKLADSLLRLAATMHEDRYETAAREVLAALHETATRSSSLGASYARALIR